MTILDTNVISELMRPEPLARVVDWLDSTPRDNVGTTAITVSEILLGLAKLPKGKRRDRLFAAAEQVLTIDLSRRIVAFDDAAAAEYAALVVSRERAGKPISMADAQIAAICRCGTHTLATRNVDDFEDTGISVINPWEA